MEKQEKVFKEKSIKLKDVIKQRDKLKSVYDSLDDNKDYEKANDSIDFLPS
jgi:hypothetical protein